MKSLLILVTIFVSQFGVASQAISIDELTEKIKSQNLTVLQNAEKVYQAKLSIDEARLSLLPRLNLWNIGKVMIEPTALLDVFQDVAPFLVPSNWFRLQSAKILYKAEQEGYRALQANEIYAARGLYLKVLMDQQMYENLKEHYSQLAEIRAIAEDRLDLGLERPELVREVQIQHLKIEEDVAQMKLLVDYEKSTLNQALGLPVDTDLRLQEVKLPDDSELEPIDPIAWEESALKNSPEIRQYDHFLKVIPKIKSEIFFSFLGVPTLSRGTAGGVFDGIPVSQGLGFATGKQMAIAKSQKKVLEMQKNGVAETLKRQVLNVSQIHNSALRLYPSQKMRYQLSQENYQTLKQKLTLGDHVSLLEVATTLLSLSQSNASYAEVSYRFVMNFDMLSRLSLTGPYSSTKENQK